MPFMGISQNLAFPTAEGFGRFTTGGRGGKVIKVTNLNDQGEGSLRAAIKEKGARIIVFDVSGTIQLESKLEIKNSNVTIAGQTAPGDGITIAGYSVAIKTDNVILRYLRFRLGDVNKVQDDAIGGRDRRDIILDHCSMSWATDEVASFYQNHNFTMQWCIVSEALNHSVHEKGNHGYGGIWGGAKVSFHHNLIASNNSRTPRFSGSPTTENLSDEFVDFRNNVIYNWGENNIYGGERGTYNMVNNYFKFGPATPKSKKDRIVNPYEPYGKFFVDGNFIEGFPEISKNNWDGGVQCDDFEMAKAKGMFPIDQNVETQSAEDAYQLVLLQAGASLRRDAVDERIVNDAKTGTASVGNGIIDSQAQVGGWPELTTEPPLQDTDLDGMPDSWEQDQGLNPQENDTALFSLDSVYTNIEVYINSLVK
ncbi:pectate lyase family protein [Mangrovimonas xylaniphaga]|uniref:pectate lyase family protein n=1 Tax=Mangrovimonas xylaniphaga TaxID=1645915 RepID=UPI0006B5248C|nr:pectate lyase [Mangrovimonas xylaniphaga]